MTWGAPWARTASDGSARMPVRRLAVALLATLGCAPPRVPPVPGVLTIAEEQAASFQRNFNPLQYASEVGWAARQPI
jgi:hypothetical protein